MEPIFIHKESSIRDVAFGENITDKNQLIIGVFIEPKR